VLVFRYLAKEVFMTLLALTVILMFIIVSNQLVGYLNRAASGRIPGLLVLKLLFLEMPNLLTVLLPLGFYMSVMLAFGRLYSENEMLVLQACGMSTAKLLRYTLIMGLTVSVFVACMIHLNPQFADKRAKILQTSGVKAFIQMLSPQHFQALPNQQVLYIDSINRKHTQATGLFLAQRNTDSSQSWKWQIIAARDMELKKNAALQDEIVMNNGQIYRLSPGALNAQYGTFKHGVIKVPEPVLHVQEDLRTISTQNLWKSRHQSLALNAEFQWRISIIVMSLVLVFVAVPLSRVNPRSGKFSKLLPAILVFLLYINFLFLWRDKLNVGQWQQVNNMLVVHLGVLVLGLFLLWQQKRKLS
jgi:lipopolysaccharide export system permease protein